MLYKIQYLFVGLLLSLPHISLAANPSPTQSTSTNAGSNPSSNPSKTSTSSSSSSSLEPKNSNSAIQSTAKSNIVSLPTNDEPLGSGCTILLGSMTCPEWKKVSILKSSEWTLNPYLKNSNSTQLSFSEQFDHYVYNRTHQYQLDPSNPRCLILNQALHSLLQPLICAEIVADPINKNCPSYPKPVCQADCNQKVEVMLAMMDSYPNCFQNDSESLNKLTNYLLKICEKSGFAGQSGSCVLVNNQEDTTSLVQIDRRMMICIIVSISILITILITLLILQLLKTYRKSTQIHQTSHLPLDRDEPNEKDGIQQAHHTFFARREDEIHLNRNDKISIWQQFDDGWALGKNLTTQKNGLFPLKFLADSGPDHQSMIIPIRTSSLSVMDVNLLPSQNKFRSKTLPKQFHKPSASHLTGLRDLRLLPYNSYDTGLHIRSKSSSQFPKLSMVKSQNDISITSGGLSGFKLMSHTNNNSLSSLASYDSEVKGTPPPPIRSPPRPPIGIDI